jgi:hypothetical protein
LPDTGTAAQAFQKRHRHSAEPKKTATVKVTVVGTKLVTRHLVAVRA